jgi:hypothetical protein
MRVPPLAPIPVDADPVAEPPALALTAPDEVTDSRLADLASLALVAIERQFTADPRDDAAVGRIITTVFGRIDSDDAFGQLPDQMGGSNVRALIEDPAELRRIVEVVRVILAEGVVLPLERLPSCEGPLPRMDADGPGRRAGVRGRQPTAR